MKDLLSPYIGRGTWKNSDLSSYIIIMGSWTWKRFRSLPLYRLWDLQKSRSLLLYMYVLWHLEKIRAISTMDMKHVSIAGTRTGISLYKLWDPPPCGTCFRGLPLYRLWDLEKFQASSSFKYGLLAKHRANYALKSQSSTELVLIIE